ncbi:MAG: hypothetical protein GQ550_06555 [Gammaproteobacteria bacterium]|nr:hypothetical protein [Gammaproteobacteria bacterium]
MNIFFAFGITVFVKCLHEFIKYHPLIAGHRQVQITGIRIAVKLGGTVCGQLCTVTLQYITFIIIVIIIAIELGISIKTVELHRANLMAKMQAKTSTELMRMALIAEL